MTIKKILTIPDPILRKKSTPVTQVNKDTQSLMDDMLETMYDAPGIGLAAIQIGVPKRVIVMDLSKDNDEKKTSIFYKPRNYLEIKIKFFLRGGLFINTKSVRKNRKARKVPY